MKWVQQAFPDGVIWVSVGKESTVDMVTRLRELGKVLNDDLSRYDTEPGRKNQCRSTVRSKATLMVVDDGWKISDIGPCWQNSLAPDCCLPRAPPRLPPL